MEEAPLLPEEFGSSRPWQLLLLSAKTDSALKSATVNLTNYLKQHPDLNLADVAYTLQSGRQAFDYRQTVVCRDIAEAIAKLENPKSVSSSEGIRKPLLLLCSPDLVPTMSTWLKNFIKLKPYFKNK